MTLLQTFTACGSQTWGMRVKLFTPYAMVVGGVKEMVEKVLVDVGASGSIKELSILDHGGVTNNISWVQLGSDFLEETEVDTGVPEPWRALASLKGLFADEGFLFFMNCGAGQSPKILTWAAKLTGTRVYGGTGFENGAGFNDGYYVVAWPDGTIKERVARPRTTVASAIVDSHPAAKAAARSIGAVLDKVLP